MHVDSTVLSPLSGQRRLNFQSRSKPSSGIHRLVFTSLKTPPETFEQENPVVITLCRIMHLCLLSPYVKSMLPSDSIHHDGHQTRSPEGHLHTQRRASPQHCKRLQSGKEKEKLLLVCNGYRMHFINMMEARSRRCF